MKQKLIRWSQSYATALQKHLQQGARASLAPALRLGRQAVGLGLETLELARIHERAFATLASIKSQPGLTLRAEIFFNEAITPIVAMQEAARQSQVHLRRLEATLDRRTEELAVARRQRQRGEGQRQFLADNRARERKHYARCLVESLQLQNRLRQLTHQALTDRETDRTKISHDLQDEIAQTLLGINVRLLALKQHAGCSTQNLKKEITSAQRLVLESAESVRQFARELNACSPARQRAARPIPLPPARKKPTPPHYARATEAGMLPRKN